MGGRVGLDGWVRLVGLGFYVRAVPLLRFWYRAKPQKGHGVHANKLVRRVAGLGKAVVMIGWCLVDGDGERDGSIPDEFMAADGGWPGLAFHRVVPGRAHLVIAVRCRPNRKLRCGRCGSIAPGYDQGGGIRVWRHVEIGWATCALVGAATRVSCPEHGVTVAAVPWARHDSPLTRAFDDVLVNMAVKSSKKATADRYGVSWRAGDNAGCRVADEALARVDLFEGLRAIAIDEVKYKKGQRYLTIVSNHATGRVIWAKKGRNKKVVESFFAGLGAERAALLEIVTCDGAAWTHDVVKVRAPNADICLDTFHVVSWATKALDEVRRDEWNRLRREGNADAARAMKGTRWLLLRNWANLKPGHKGALRDVHAANQRLGRAWELKEELVALFDTGWVHVGHAFNEWLAWASRSKLAPFVKLPAPSERSGHRSWQPSSTATPTGLPSRTTRRSAASEPTPAGSTTPKRSSR